MRRPTALYRITSLNRSRNQHTNPRTQKSVSGGFSFGAGSAALMLAATWRFHGHHCAIIYQAFPDPERTILRSSLRHTSAQQSAIIGPSLIQAVTWLLHGLIMGRYKAIKEPDNDHRMLLVIVRPSKRLYLAIIGPDKDLLPPLTICGAYLAPNWSPLTVYWSFIGHYLAIIAPATDTSTQCKTQPCCITAPVAALHSRSQQPGLTEQQGPHNHASRRLFRQYRSMVTTRLTTSFQRMSQRCYWTVLRR